MKKIVLVMFFATTLMLATSASADVLSSGAGWTVHDGSANGSYTVSSSGAVDIEITDLFVVGDNYHVDVNGVPVGSTSVAGWNTYCGDAFGACSHYTTNPDVAEADAYFAHLDFSANNGDVIDIFGTAPSGFSDVTWAIRADDSPVPEPASMILLGSGIAGIVARKRKLS